MAILKMTDVGVSAASGSVVFRVPVDGRPRSLRLDPVDAIQMANQIATAAIEIVPVAARAAMTAEDFHLKPYDASGNAHLAIITEHGPFVIRLTAEGLHALATAGEAALEFARAAGRA